MFPVFGVVFNRVVTMSYSSSTESPNYYYLPGDLLAGSPPIRSRAHSVNQESPPGLQRGPLSSQNTIIINEREREDAINSRHIDRDYAPALRKISTPTVTRHMRDLGGGVALPSLLLIQESTSQAWDDEIMVPIDNKPFQLLKERALMVYGAPVKEPETAAARAEYKEVSQYVHQSGDVTQFITRALGAMNTLHPSVSYKLWIELADSCKRCSRQEEASACYFRALYECPTAVHIWLEWSKMEEEAGNIKLALRLLQTAIQCCGFNDGVVLRILRTFEKLGRIKAARAVLGACKDLDVMSDSIAKIMSEGAQLEARQRNYGISHVMMSMLVQQNAIHGTLWLEWTNILHTAGDVVQMFNVTLRGIVAAPKYGPLWLSLLRVIEELCLFSSPTEYEQAMSLCQKAIPLVGTDETEVLLRIPRRHPHRNIWGIQLTNEVCLVACMCTARETSWRSWLEGALVIHRLGGDLLTIQSMLMKSLKSSPWSVVWKVWYCASLMDPDNQLVLLERSLAAAPKKMKCTVMLELSRTMEYRGDVDIAREFLASVRKTHIQEWKVFLESVMMEFRCGNTSVCI